MLRWGVGEKNKDSMWYNGCDMKNFGHFQKRHNSEYSHFTYDTRFNAHDNIIKTRRMIQLIPSLNLFFQLSNCFNTPLANFTRHCSIIHNADFGWISALIKLLEFIRIVAAQTFGFKTEFISLAQTNCRSHFAITGRFLKTAGQRRWPAANAAELNETLRTQCSAAQGNELEDTGRQVPLHVN